mmetsp:Transcript_6244/g.7707  ORF Transcript_6244/g.7707 Transcript_6244/m.7707 type:complete len:89 (+) Transcript_6244:458-724(+)
MYRSLYTVFTSIAEKHHYQICNNNVCTSDSCVPAANGQNSNVFFEQAPSSPKDCDDKMNVPLILVTLYVEGVPVFSGRVMKIHVVRKF